MAEFFSKQPFFDDLLEAKKVGTLEAYDKVISSSPGLGRIPRLLQDVIRHILEFRSAKIICDPFAGLGFLLEIVRQTTSAKKSIAFSMQNHEQQIIFDNHDWQFGSPLELLDDLNDHLDVAVSILPIGLPPKKHNLIIKEKHTVELFGPLEQLILANTTSKLRKDGIGLFVLSSSFFLNSSKQNSVLSNFNSIGCYVEAAFELPLRLFDTAVTTYLVVVKKQVHERMFVAKLSNNFNTNKQIVSNYNESKEGGSVELGHYVNPLEFNGIDALRFEEEFASSAKVSGLTALSLEEVSKSINLGRYGESFNFSNEENSIYVPLIGKSEIVESIEDLKIKKQNYAQVVIDEAKSQATFVAKFLNLELGKKSLESKKSGMIPKLNKQTLKDVKIIIPDLSLQGKLLHIESKISKEENTIISLHNELFELKNKLWNNPNFADEADQKISDFSRRITKETKEQTELTLEDWFENLPYPLSSILRAWQATSSDDFKSKYEHLLHFFEATAQFISIIFLSAYIKNESLFDEHRKKLNKTLEKHKLSYERPTFGTWKHINEYLSKQTRKLLQGEKDEEKLCSEIFCDTTLVLPNKISNLDVIEILNQTNTLRNNWKGHSGIVGQDEAKLRNERLFRELLNLRMALGDWKDSVLVQAVNCKARHGMFENLISRLMGSNSESLKETIKLIIWLDVEKLYITQNNQQDALELIPLIQLSSSPKSNKTACYFFNRMESKGTKTRFISYHYIDKPEINEEFIDTSNTIRFLTRI